MICVLPGLVVGVLDSQSQSLCPVTLFMMAGHRAGDTRMNLAVSSSLSRALPLSSFRIWNGAVPQMWWVVLFRSGPHSIMSEAFVCLYLRDPQRGATGTLC